MRRNAAIVGMVMLLPTFAVTSFASAGGRDCTRVVGFSQTRNWYADAAPTFESIVPNAEWELLYHSGGGTDEWANPSYRAWGSTPYSRCGSSPTRALLTISDDTYLPDVAAWRTKIEAFLATARVKMPTVAEFVLQPVVGGPADGTCTVSVRGVPTVVRATVNHPYIDRAIALVDLAYDDVVAGASPSVSSCAMYRDSIGHLTRRGAAYEASELGSYYVDMDT
jgi:hypothetical protein